MARTFERRVARVLGGDPARTAALLAAASDRLGPRSYRVRAIAFLVATAPPGRWVLPGSIRSRAIRSLAGKMLNRPGDSMYFLGDLDEVPADPCRGLARP